MNIIIMLTMKYQEPFSQILHEINNILITKYNKKKVKSLLLSIYILQEGLKWKLNNFK